MHLVFPAVQSNHRLVVQHVSGMLTFNQAPQNAIAATNGEAFAVPSVAPATNTLAFDQPVLVYVDGGSQLALQVFGYGVPIAAANMTATGYLLDCSAAPCAAIAQ